MKKPIHKPFRITKEMQLKELSERIPPVLNVDVVIFRRDNKKFLDKGKFLIAHRNPNHLPKGRNLPTRWLFPGGRMKYTETPQETAERILKNEVPGVKARLKKLATVISDKGYDYRAYGVTIYFLYEYLSGKPKSNNQLNKFIWGTSEDIKNKDNVYDQDISVLEELEAVVRTMNTTEDEILVEVDKNNKEIGTIVKRVAHSTSSRYHRAAHIMIFNSRGEVILQQRSLNKSSGAGLWDMHGGGHQAAGMTIEQTAKQELMEEVGIDIDLKLLKVWLFKAKNQLEYCHVYYDISDGPYAFDRNEVQAIKAFNCDKLLKGDYDKSYKFVEPFAKEYTKELKFFWEKLQ